jgi:hypothetical protein
MIKEVVASKEAVEDLEEGRIIPLCALGWGHMTEDIVT